MKYMYYTETELIHSDSYSYMSSKHKKLSLSHMYTLYCFFEMLNK